MGAFGETAQGEAAFGAPAPVGAGDGERAVLRGKPVAEAIDDATARLVRELSAHGVVPGLAVVRVGDRADDRAYERSLLKRAEALGVRVQVESLAEDATQEELASALARVNADAAVHGCLMFRPLPTGLDELAACNAIDPHKDVDGVGASSLAGVFMGLPEGFAPCTAQACLELLDAYEVPLEGRHAVVVGRSLVVGKPVAMLLSQRNATVTLAHSRTVDLPALMRGADIVVCAAGKARLFGRDCFQAGQVVLDVGMNTAPDGSLCGDVDYGAVSPVVAALTPVPGGVGSVTTSVLMRHVVEAAEASCGSRGADLL